MKLNATEGCARVKAGAGIAAGLVALSFGDLSSSLVENAPRWIVVAFVVGIFLTGFLLARTYIAYSNCLLLLESAGLGADDMKTTASPRRDARRNASKDRKSAAVVEYHKARDAFFVTVTLLALSAVAYLVAVLAGAAAPAKG